MPAPAIERRQSRPAVQEISAPMVAGQGGGKTVEQTVAQIASDYNDGPAKADDRMIAWSSAKAAGKEVIFTNVLRLRPNLSADELKQFREASIPDVTRQTCALPGNHIGFDRGMVYTFVYLSQSNQGLMRFSVDRKICALAK